MTGMTYAISDIHGRYDLLESALVRIEQHAGNNVATLVVLGDMVDRGPGSAQVVRRLRAGPTKPNWTWRCLYGNHEDLFVAFMAKQNYDVWLYHGGYETLLSYGFDPADPDAFQDKQMQDDADWMTRLDYVYMDRYRAFVHAGFEDKPLKEQSIQNMIWSKDLAGIDKRFCDRYVVHGHIPMQDGPIITDNKMNLDVGAFATGRLVIAVFEDDRPGKPIGVLEVSSQEGNYTRGDNKLLRPVYKWASKRKEKCTTKS